MKTQHSHINAEIKQLKKKMYKRLTIRPSNRGALAGSLSRDKGMSGEHGGRQSRTSARATASIEFQVENFLRTANHPSSIIHVWPSRWHRQDSREADNRASVER